MSQIILPAITNHADLQGVSVDQHHAINHSDTQHTDGPNLKGTLFDAKGDILVATAADTAARLAVGADGTALIADAAAASGLKWALTAPKGHVVKSATQNNSTTSYADVTDLGIPVAANETLAFQYTLVCSAGATGTGIHLAMNGPTSPSFFTAKIEVPTTAGTPSTPTSATIIIVFVEAYDTGPLTTGSAGTSRVVAKLEGIIENGSSAGTLIPRLKSEVSGSNASVRKGSVGFWW